MMLEYNTFVEMDYEELLLVEGGAAGAFLHGLWDLICDWMGW
jgi:hypothetical protein